jgi:hypothetical protein
MMFQANTNGGRLHGFFQQEERKTGGRWKEVTCADSLAFSWRLKQLHFSSNILYGHTLLGNIYSCSMYSRWWQYYKTLNLRKMDGLLKWEPHENGIITPEDM